MAIFHVCGKRGNATCSRCFAELINTFSKTGCGRPLAACPYCKILYTLKCSIFTGDGLVDYLAYLAHKDTQEWKWVRLDKYCLKVAV